VALFFVDIVRRYHGKNCKFCTARAWNGRILMSGDLDLLSFDPSCDTQRAFIIKCACQVWLEFVVYFLIHLAKMDFCDVFRPQVTLTLTS